MNVFSFPKHSGLSKIEVGREYSNLFMVMITFSPGGK